MPTETLTKNGQLTSERVPGIVKPERADTLRALAIEQIERIRRFKVHAVTFALGIPILGLVWVLTEFYEEHTWPDRFASDPDVAGTWDPWFFFAAGIWAGILVIHALRTYFRTYFGPRFRLPIERYIHRPPTNAELDRAVERLTSRR